MNRFWLAFVLALACVAVGTAPAHAAEAKWLFTNEAEMKATIARHSGNPRANYYIIMRASKRDLIGQAAMTYRDLARKRLNDANAYAAYAFSQYVATGEMSRYQLTYNAPPLIRELRGYQMEADYYRGEALKLAPRSPDVLLMTGMALFWTSGRSYEGDTANKKKACDYLRKAVRLAPKWADAHYWLAKHLINLWPVVPNKEEVGKEAIAALKRAETLEPRLKPDCVILYAYAYQALKRPDKQLEYLEAYIASNQEHGKDVRVLEWRDSLRKQLAKTGS